MKKRLAFVLVVLLAVSSFCFADGFDIGLSARLPAVEEIDLAVGLNIAGSVYFNNFVGIGIFGNVLYDIGSDDLGMIFDALLGPVIKVVNNTNFSLPVAFGVYGYYPLVFSNISGDNLNVGIGASGTAQVKFGRTNHFYFRLQAAYEFLNGGEFVINPSVGVGFGRNR